MIRLRVLLVVGLLLFGACSSESGDKRAGNGSTTSSPVPGTTSSTAAAFLRDSGWLMGTKADGQSDVILATTDGGRTWQEQFTRPAPAR